MRFGASKYLFANEKKLQWNDSNKICKFHKLG